MNMVGEDLTGLVARYDAGVTSFSRVSPLQSAQWDRAAFRIEFSDGTFRKGRRFESVEAAARFVELARHLPPGCFPRMVAHHGTAVLSEWIDGSTPAMDADAHDLLLRVGSILRLVHDVRVEHPWPDAPLFYPGARWRDDLAHRLDRLFRAGLLAQAEGATLLDVAASEVPARKRVGLVHGDIAPENVVIDRSGGLRFIDDDGLSLHAPAFDFARLWYRWPMTGEMWRAFERGYGSPAAFAQWRTEFRHWVIVVLIGASDFRLRHDLPDAAAPLRRLREVLARETFEEASEHMA